MIRVGVFCDVENVVSTFALIKQKEESERGSHENLINALSFQGWRVITKPVRTLPDGSIKTNMDLDMAIEILQTSPYLEEIVLITGDGDFVPIIDLLSKMGKRVWVIGTRKGSVAIEGSGIL
jgi:uncharacterized LabA/DUF88 family protein